MAENSKGIKPSFKMPGLDMNKLNAGAASGMNPMQMTTREEQEQYKIMGV